MLGERTAVVVAAAGAAWEVEALRIVGSPPARAVLLKRCVDLPDLLATAATGQARLAIVADHLGGLDADSVTRLRGLGVAVVVVTTASGPARELPGVHAVIPGADVAVLAALVPAAASALADAASGHDPAGPTRGRESVPTEEEVPPAGVEGRVVAVWGPAGAPGRTTVAVNLADGLAQSGSDTLLVDADGYGGAVAQHLGVLDEVSGLLAAARAGNAGTLDPAHLAAVARDVGGGLRVLTGLPRADRWSEVRPAAFEGLLATARSLCRYVVLDLGFSLESDAPGFGTGTPQRNHMTVAGLDHADEVVVVGSADPVGLARLARGLVELAEVVPTATLRVVVNRVRPSLGWGEQDIRAMVEGFVQPSSMHLLPYDAGAADRALVSGRPLAQVADSGLCRGVADLVRAVADQGDATARRSSYPRRGRGSRLRRRRAGRAR